MNKEVLTTFYDKDGNVIRQHIAGTLKVRLTNVATDKSVDLNISGPGTYTFPPDGSVDLVGTGSGSTSASRTVLGRSCSPRAGSRPRFRPEEAY